MKITTKLAAVILLTPLFAACSKGPSAGDVEALIEAEYDQANSMMDSAIGSAGSSEVARAMSGMMAGMVPKLEEVKNVNCDEADGDNAYLCTADITQTLQGETRTDKANFMVHKVNDEWVLRQ
ncbi:hypothetical protein [uncultured Psychrobacter sp.]|jgi:hypothetical protein|uniref:hypothetical protein n=1 Tax=uncultured Psychrobacter sp. TaxID=259303 RepID=UPI00259ACCFD|nr:hypothetical protein [uncultured Psychrobacter sp.]